VSSLSVSNSSDAKSKKRAISIENLGLVYKTTLDKRPTFKTRIRRLARRKRQTRIVHAVNNLSLEIKYGTVLGVIGTNGAGKSSLMRVISGILPPTSGRVEVFGKVSTLLALGVGFNGKLTGRDNVYLGGLAAGMSRAQIESKFDSIVEFAGLEEVIDAPMRTYSSGMYSRLAFSVAISLDPDILIIDEALSTGDARYKVKSLNKILEMRNEDRVIIIVSHAMRTLKTVCDEVLWLDHGKIVAQGDPTTVIKSYREFLHVGEAPESDEDL
jgi:ABC-type polysaccharide/polyol phosphate transport system ATPase subunit